MGDGDKTGLSSARASGWGRQVTLGVALGCQAPLCLRTPQKPVRTPGKFSLSTPATRPLPPPSGEPAGHRERPEGPRALEVHALKLWGLQSSRGGWRRTDKPHLKGACRDSPGVLSRCRAKYSLRFANTSPFLHFTCNKKASWCQRTHIFREKKFSTGRSLHRSQVHTRPGPQLTTGFAVSCMDRTVELWPF